MVEKAGVDGPPLTHNVPRAGCCAPCGVFTSESHVTKMLWRELLMSQRGAPLFSVPLRYWLLPQLQCYFAIGFSTLKQGKEFSVHWPHHECNRTYCT